MTRFVTWDLASSSDAKSAVKAALEPTPDLARALDDDFQQALRATKGGERLADRKSKQRKWFSAKDEQAVEASIVGEWRDSYERPDASDALSSDDLVEALAQPRGARRGSVEA